MMNPKTPIQLIPLLLILSLILSACGGGATGAAEDFVNALDVSDKEAMKEATCPELHDSIDQVFEKLGNATERVSNLDDVQCESDSETQVSCTLITGSQAIIQPFVVQGDKVCDTAFFEQILSTENDASAVDENDSP